MDFAQELELVASASARLRPIAVFRIKCLTRYWNYWCAVPRSACQRRKENVNGYTDSDMSTAEAVNVAHAVGVRAWF